MYGLQAVFYFSLKLHSLVWNTGLFFLCFQVLLQWVKEAWETLSVDIIIKIFKKTGISNEMDGTEGEEIWYESSDDEDSELEFPG